MPDTKTCLVCDCQGPLANVGHSLGRAGQVQCQTPSASLYCVQYYVHRPLAMIEFWWGVRKVGEGIPHSLSCSRSDRAIRRR